jgi:ribosomal protein S18 acetylase RimI-like enzyme
MTPSLREATPDDLDSCVDLFCRTFAQPPWNEEWDQAIARKRLLQVFQTPGFVGAVAEQSGLLGFAIGFCEPWKDGYVYYLKEACVDPSIQRQGIGTRLMGFLTERLPAQGVAKIYLLTARGDSSEAFYAKLGFYTSGKMILMGKYLG